MKFAALLVWGACLVMDLALAHLCSHRPLNKEQVCVKDL